MHYIHQNPRKAGLVNKLEDWKYSSFREYIGPDTVANCNRNLLLHLAGYEMSTFFEDSYAALDTEVVKEIL